MKADQIAGVLEPVLEQFTLDLDAVEVKPAGKRSVVRVVVDGDGPDGTGPSLDDIAEATRAVSSALDASDVTGAGPYTLEVTSRGVSRPLILPRHWRRNVDRLVKVTLTTGETITGRITGSDETQAALDVDGAPRQIGYDEIDTALIQVELNRKPRPAPADPAQPEKEN
ncbi:ribosome maturation factor RimP [Microlunatus soli]|uniref:Ribosome maturation factor RimP n=1 Tax=Microlunatus soli TaxID=630515 RepID=A0A1H1NS98_9ACTN|nr:ribosome maturation factor RimP [Microlunatus soli]SDS01803.1 ribosome maturation factor RimP [Microlunatus soli]